MIRSAWAVALIGLVAAGVANAKTLEYDCDTQAEHFSVLKSVQQGPDYKASGAVSPRAIFPSKKYATIGMLDFEPQDKSWRVRLGLTALAAGKQPIVMATVEITRAGKVEEPVLLGDVLEYQIGKSYPISLTLGPDGGIATLGTHSAPVKVSAQGKIDVSVVCSGGEFLFTDLDLGG